MNPEGLLASAVINIGLAFIILSIFSIFKKQPSNAPVYYARRLSKQENITFDHSITLSRFLPSISWISRALRVTEDEIIDTGGLDALIIIRLFKFGSVCVKFFSMHLNWNMLVIRVPLNLTRLCSPYSYVVINNMLALQHQFLCGLLSCWIASSSAG